MCGQPSRAVLDGFGNGVERRGRGENRFVVDFRDRRNVRPLSAADFEGRGRHDAQDNGFEPKCSMLWRR